MLKLINFKVEKYFNSINFELRENTLNYLYCSNIIKTTTLLQYLYGLHNDYVGDIFINNQKLTDDNYILLRDDLQIISGKTYKSFLFETVFEEIIYNFELQSLSKNKIDQLITELKVQFPLIDFSKKIKNLSTGERQLVNILSKINSHKKIIILDNCLINLDESIKIILIKYLQSLNLFIFICTNEISEIKNRTTFYDLDKEHYCLRDKQNIYYESENSNEITEIIVNNDINQKFNNIINDLYNSNFQILLVRGNNGVGKSLMINNFFLNSDFKKIFFINDKIFSQLIALNVKELLKKISVDIDCFISFFEKTDIVIDINKFLIKMNYEEIILIYTVAFSLAKYYYFIFDEVLDYLSENKFQLITNLLISNNQKIITVTHNPQKYHSFLKWEIKLVKND